MAAIASATEPAQAGADRRAARLAAGRLRVELALQHVEEAQRELGRAQQELFSVIGLAPDNDRLGKLYEKLKAEWYRLHKRFDAVYTRPRGHIGQIDRDATPADIEPHRQGCGHTGWRPR